MGKGRIISAQGEGRYIIEIVEDRARAESARTLAAQRVTELDQRISDAEGEVPALQQAVDDAAQAQDQAIELHQQQMAEGGESDVDLTALAVAVAEAAAQRDRKRLEIGQMQADRLSLQTRIDRIDALPPLRQIEAWCADYTEDLAGEVATAEVPGEIGQVIIKPGFADSAAWSASADGAIQPALSGTPASVFYNLALLPGWQKWRPTFRLATISNINNDLCDITLDAAASSQQGLGVNVQSSYSGVPIMYMDCNGGAFEEGDRALVAFSGSTEQPMVVGFEKEPRQCDFWFLYSMPHYIFSKQNDTRRTHQQDVITSMTSIDSCWNRVDYHGVDISYAWMESGEVEKIDFGHASAVQGDVSIFGSSSGASFSGSGAFVVDHYDYSRTITGYNYSPTGLCNPQPDPPGENTYESISSLNYSVSGSISFSFSLGEFEYGVQLLAQCDSRSSVISPGPEEYEYSVETLVLYVLDGVELPPIPINLSFSYSEWSPSDFRPVIDYKNLSGTRQHRVKRKSAELLIIELKDYLYAYRSAPEEGEPGDRCVSFLKEDASSQWQHIALPDHADLFSNETDPILIDRINALMSLDHIPPGGGA